MVCRPKHKANAEVSISDWKTVHAPKAVQAVFAAVCAVVCLVPLVGMAWDPTTETTENRELASVPQLIQDGSFNWDYLSDWGTYFEDHFAYRNELVSLNAELQAGLLQTSPTDSVVVGTDGWLYYGGTLSDYCGLSRLSDRAISNIANNLALMQGYCEAQGATFSVAIAPNKNSLYPQNMPYYYLQAQGSDLLELQAALDEYGVNYSDLYGAFSAQDQILYYLRDTHWNTKGALLAYACIESSLGRSTNAGELVPSTVDGYVGDLNSMLYPTTSVPEQDYSYADQLEWSMTEGQQTSDSWIVTQGGEDVENSDGAEVGAGDADGANDEGVEGSTSSLLMYRDSFANNMMQFFADSYDTAYFSKMVPYDLTQVSALGVQDVVVERAERHLADLGTDPAIMEAPTVDLGEVDLPELATLNAGSEEGASTATAEESASSEVALEGVSIAQDGSFYVVSGELPQQYCSQDVQMFIGIQQGEATTWYVPFTISTETSDYGYKAYVPQDALAGASCIWVACESDDGEITCVQATQW